MLFRFADFVICCIDGMRSWQQSASKQAVKGRWEVASRRAAALGTKGKGERALVVLGIGVERHPGCIF